MNVPEIIKALEPCTGPFPMEAMRAAVQQREAITPELLGILEVAAEDPVKFAEKQGSMLHMFAMYLLAQFREQRAYRFLVRTFSAPGETSFALAGDTVTERLDRILGSVYDGDPGPLRSLIEDDNANAYVRNAALRAFIVLVESDQMAREEVVAYYRSLFEGKLKRTFSYTWSGLVRCVANLPAPELLDEVRRVFAQGLTEGGASDLDWIERRLGRPHHRDRERYALIVDAIREMEWWASFHPKGCRPRNLSIPGQPASPPAAYSPPPPVHSPKIGRNDPCPCGSGKKYKKCCGLK